MAQITTRFPVVVVDDFLVGVAVGTPNAEFGDEVSLFATYSKDRFPTLYVHGVDTIPANQIEQEVIDLFGLPSTETFVLGLAKAYGTGLPADVPVTIYTLGAIPVEDTL